MPPETARAPQSTDPWDRILAQIAKSVRPQQFSTWFKPVRALSATPERLELEVPNAWTQGWLAKNYLDVIRESAAGGARLPSASTVLQAQEFPGSL